MAMVWNNINKGVNSSSGNHRNHFREHNECMKLFRKSRDFQEHNQRMRAFRLAHPKDWKQRGQRVSQVQENPLALPPIALIRKLVLARYSLN